MVQVKMHMLSPMSDRHLPLALHCAENALNPVNQVFLSSPRVYYTRLKRQQVEYHISFQVRSKKKTKTKTRKSVFTRSLTI